jgi:tetratricopeptide (TPR) repeat protein
MYQGALAYEFVPTQTEWVVWPEYCRARYVSTNIGSTSQFRNLVSASSVKQWERRLGDAFLHVHHYCAGLSYFEQAKRYRSDPKEKERLLHRAIGEATYTYIRTSPENPMHSIIGVTLARIYNKLNNFDKSKEYVEKAISLHPQYEGSYVFLGMVYRENKHEDEALAVLKKGNQAVSGKSAEILYVMGLIYYEKGDYSRSSEYAQKAYRLGYPLLGLKRKLSKVGHLLSP